MSQSIIGILGLGIFGRTVAKQLSKFDREVIAIDNNEENVDLVANEVTSAIIGDFTDFELLETAGVANCDVVVIATGTNLESAVLAVMHCKSLGVPYIICKARSATFEKVLLQLGADEIISPERESGKRLASHLLKNQIEEIFPLDSTISIIEFEVPEKWVGKSLVELNLRQKYDLNVIGIRSARFKKLSSNIDINKPIKEKTIFVAITESNTFESYDYLHRLN